MGISFANPKALWILLAVISGLILSYYYSILLQKRLARWIQPKLWPSIIPEFSRSVFIRKTVFLATGLVFLVIALARPQWGEHEEMIQSEGMDILFLLDLSNSMLSEDTPPSRLNRAQTFIKKTLTNLADDRVGIIGFAGKAFLTAPLTTDFGYISEITDTLDPSAMLSQGTNISSAIETAIKAFERGGEDDRKISRAIILISDGEDFGEDAMAAAKKLKDFGAGFITLSIGTSEGGPIPVRNEAGILQTYKKDLAGKTVLTRVNRDLLAKLADAGGGSFVELVNPDDAAYTVTKQLKSYTRGAKKEQREVTKIDRYQSFLAAAIFFFMLQLFTGYRKAWIFLLLIAPLMAKAQTLDSYLDAKRAEKLYEKQDFESSAKNFEESRKTDAESSVLQYNEATALAKAKKNEDAIFNFSEASKKALSQGDYETAAKSLYNEGITQSEQKNLPEAYDRLSKAIEMAKISQQPEVEAKARDALMTLIQKQKQQSEDQKKEQDKKDQEKKDDPGKKDQPDKKDGQKPDDKKEGDGKKEDDQKDKPGQDKSKKQDPKQNQPTEEGKNRQFKSGTLSKDVAESIMNDLSDREKQLYQKRMKDKKPHEVPNDKDW